MNFYSRLLPFFSLVITLALMVLGIFIFSYLLIFGALVGLVLFAVGFIRKKIRERNGSVVRQESAESQEKHSGKTYDHEEL